MDKISMIKDKVNKLLSFDRSGHGMDHTIRVYNLALKFAKNEKDADKEVVSLIALLHDADDYKLFGRENAENLTNTKRIMRECGVSQDNIDKVCEAMSNIGYSKRLSGKCPNTIEAKIVSDADMCDAMGAVGVIRTHTYSIKEGRPFFDKAAFPKKDLTIESYTTTASDSAVCHFFDKLLKLKNYMLTESGRVEAEKRHKIMVDFLMNIFEEEEAPEWIDYLNEFLKE